MTIRALAGRSSASLLIALVAACGGREKSASDSASVVSSQPTPVISAPVTPDTCVKNGLWAACSVEKRLKQAGFVVTRLDSASADRDGFSVKPVIYSLGKTRLEVFLYKSESDASKDAALLDTLAVAPKGKTGSWASTPMFIRNTNLLGVIITENGRQAERVSLALTAGPPQKGSAR